MYKLISLTKCNDNNHKYQVEILNKTTNRIKTIKFGKYGMNDYTIYSMNETAKIANEHKKRYIERHKKRENWTKSGVLTKGFYSRWLLWNKKDLKSSLNYIIKKFKL